MRHLLLFRSLVLLALLGVAAAAPAAERTTYFVPDALGSPVAAMDEQGNVLWRESYAPYGERKTKSPDNTARAAYTGKPEDAGTGLVYMGARMYDPESARFTGIDPQGFGEANPQSFGRYLYGNNAPYKYVDPDGEAGVLAGGLILVGYVARDMATSTALGAAGIPDVPFSISKLSSAIARQGAGDIITGSSIFWAGGPPAHSAAKKLADDIGGKVLAMTAGGQRAIEKSAGMAWDKALPIFAEASKDFAADAKGVAHVVLNVPAVKKTSILITDEIPEMLRNNKVSGMLIHKVKNDAD